jgi:hypothetical protein
VSCCELGCIQVLGAVSVLLRTKATDLMLTKLGASSHSSHVSLQTQLKSRHDLCPGVCLAAPGQAHPHAASFDTLPAGA